MTELIRIALAAAIALVAVAVGVLALTAHVVGLVIDEFDRIDGGPRP